LTPSSRPRRPSPAYTPRSARQDREAASLERRDGPERALVEAQDSGGGGCISRRSDDERRVGRSQAQIAIGLDQLTRRLHVVPPQAFEDKGPGGEVLDEGQLDVDTEAIEDEVVGLGDYELRRHECLALGEQNPATASW
jgi:hypothetical protein